VAAFEDIQVEAGSVELASSVFQQAERLDILNRVVLWQRAKKRVIARPAKTRAMVQGGGKKPWNQKGSGRARVGSIRCARAVLGVHCDCVGCKKGLRICVSVSVSMYVLAFL